MIFQGFQISYNYCKRDNKIFIILIYLDSIENVLIFFSYSSGKNKFVYFNKILPFNFNNARIFEGSFFWKRRGKGQLDHSLHPAPFIFEEHLI